MRLSRIVPTAVLLGLSGWATTNLIRKALRARKQPDEPARSEFDSVADLSDLEMATEVAVGDLGDLDRIHNLDDDDQTARGENWMEALEVQAVQDDDPEVELILDEDGARVH